MSLVSLSPYKLETVCLLSLSSTLLINPGPRAVCNLNNSSSNTGARVRGDTRGRCLTLSQTLAQLYSHKWRLGSVQWQPGPPPVQCTAAETPTPLVDGVEDNPLYEQQFSPQPTITLPMINNESTTCYIAPSKPVVGNYVTQFKMEKSKSKYLQRCSTGLG